MSEVLLSGDGTYPDLLRRGSDAARGQPWKPWKRVGIR